MIRRRSRSSLATTILATALALGLGALGCGNDGVQRSESGKINVSPNPVTFSETPLGETVTETLTIRNSGASALRVFKMKFEARGKATIDNLSIPKLPKNGFTLGPDESREIEIQYEPTEGAPPNAGILTIRNSDPEYSEKEPLEVDVTTRGNRPNMRVSPSIVRFPPLTPGNAMTRTVTISNVGDSPLRLFEGMTIAGSGDFRIKKISRELPYDLKPLGDGSNREKRIVKVDIQYKPTQDGTREADLVIKSNEEPGATAENPEIRRVDINANADTPCLLLSSTALNLGAVPIGGSTADALTIQNCGTKPLRISKIEFTDNSSDDEFSIELGDRDGNDDGTLDEPIELEEKGDKTNLPVLYEPIQAGSDKGTLVFHTNDPVQEEAEVEVVGRGATGECPKTVLRGRPETGTVWDQSVVRAAPLDYVLLDASKSEDPDGDIVDYTWRAIEKPDGATVNFKPWKEGDSSNMAKRRIRLLVAGDYKIGLEVEDNDGFSSCEEAVLEVSAEPDEKVHVELTWTNPKDPDEKDDNGSDVDVHLVKMGPGMWFEEPYDVYFDNPNNSSGSGGGGGIWNPESPSLDIDDRNGLGPENIQMDDPQDCQWYAVGVHYYEQRWGAAYATIRIYLGEGKSNLVWEKPDVLLEEGGNFWDAARIHWPSRKVISVNRIYDDEGAVRSEQPDVTQGMKNSGLCTSQNLYPTNK